MRKTEKPLLVYLDSSDFSVMSDPKRVHEWDIERRGLERFVAQGDIHCVFSQAHIVELAPVESTHADLAIGKVDLLVSLCGRLSLPSMDRLVTEELLALREGRPRKFDVVNTEGDWFPAIDGLFNSSRAKLVEEAAGSVIEGLQQNRALRRVAKKLVKNGAPSAKLQRQLSAAPSIDAARDLQRTYPMREADARILARYLRGQAGKEEAHHAFTASLRDPRWLVRWLSSEGVDVSKFNGWLRDSSRRMQAVVEQLSAVARTIRTLPPDQLAALGPKTIAGKNAWDRLPDELVAKLAQRMADEWLPMPVAPLPLERLHETCAGLSVLLRTFYSAVWTSTTAQPRAPLASDLGDCYHAMYAPYVDIFRPDSFMAPHIERQTATFGTEVVPKLKRLLPAIEKRLRDRIVMK
ncbi:MULTISPECIES: hypothetical protein [unclassified Roseateles]|uniref:hypothetical protein n=1 Tax=unclassified Roseateles TaxID=2626991 RepID=UPI0006F659B0|nr:MULTISPECIES: hypothetical protein [unclassified Roseateles]KQW52292.1 hypothetical protein ASC81_06840 [Pelomonas sp. Root405]